MEGNPRRTGATSFPNDMFQIHNCIIIPQQRIKTALKTLAPFDAESCAI
jgi:hypothetical protein